MVKLENLKDKQKSKIVIKEVQNFRKLIKGHERILEAIGKL